MSTLAAATALRRALGSPAWGISPPVSSRLSEPRVDRQSPDEAGKTWVSRAEVLCGPRLMSTFASLAIPKPLADTIAARGCRRSRQSAVWRSR
jgi:hypothetical protein